MAFTRESPRVTSQTFKTQTLSYNVRSSFCGLDSEVYGWGGESLTCIFHTAAQD
jgi:hypothetical protein